MDGGDADAFNEHEQPTGVPGLVVLAFTLALMSLGGFVVSFALLENYEPPSNDWGAIEKSWIPIAGLAWCAVIAGFIGLRRCGPAGGRGLAAVAIVIGIAVGLLAGLLSVAVLTGPPIYYS